MSSSKFDTLKGSKFHKWTSMVEKIRSAKGKKTTLPKNPLVNLQASSARKPPSRVQEWRRNIRYEKQDMSSDTRAEPIGGGNAWNAEHFDRGSGPETRRQTMGRRRFSLVEEETSWVHIDALEGGEHQFQDDLDLDLDLELGKRWWHAPFLDNQSQCGHMECSMASEYWEENTPAEFVYVANFDMSQQPEMLHIPMDFMNDSPSNFQHASQYDLELRHERLMRTLEEVVRLIEGLEFRFSMARMTDEDQLEEMFDSAYTREYIGLLSTREQLLKDLESIEDEVRMYGINNVTPTPPQTRPCQCQCPREEDLPRPQPPSTKDSSSQKTRSTPYIQSSSSTRPPNPAQPKSSATENPKVHLEKYNQKWKDLLQQYPTNTKLHPSRIQLPWPSPSSKFSRNSLLHPSSTLPFPATPAQLSKWTIYQFFCHASDLVPVSHTDPSTQAHTFGFVFPDSNSGNGSSNTDGKIRCLEGLRKQMKVEMVRWHEDKLRLLVGEEGARDEMVKIVWEVILELRGKVEEEIGRLML